MPRHLLSLILAPMLAPLLALTLALAGCGGEDDAAEQPAGEEGELVAEPGEPTYQRAPLSAWRRRALDRDPSQHDDARTALLALWHDGGAEILLEAVRSHGGDPERRFLEAFIEGARQDGDHRAAHAETLLNLYLDPRNSSTARAVALRSVPGLAPDFFAERQQAILHRLGAETHHVAALGALLTYAARESREDALMAWSAYAEGPWTEEQRAEALAMIRQSAQGEELAADVERAMEMAAMTEQLLVQSEEQRHRLVALQQEREAREAAEARAAWERERARRLDLLGSARRAQARRLLLLGMASKVPEGERADLEAKATRAAEERAEALQQLGVEDREFGLSLPAGIDLAFQTARDAEAAAEAHQRDPGNTELQQRRATLERDAWKRAADLGLNLQQVAAVGYAVNVWPRSGTYPTGPSEEDALATLPPQPTPYAPSTPAAPEDESAY